MADAPNSEDFAKYAAEFHERLGDRREASLVSLYEGGSPFNAIANTLGLRLTSGTRARRP